MKAYKAHPHNKHTPLPSLFFFFFCKSDLKYVATDVIIRNTGAIRGAAFHKVSQNVTQFQSYAQRVTTLRNVSQLFTGGLYVAYATTHYTSIHSSTYFRSLPPRHSITTHLLTCYTDSGGISLLPPFLSLTHTHRKRDLSNVDFH